MPLPFIPESHLSAPPDADRPLRFMEIVRRRLRERRYSRRTEDAYIYWMRRFIRYHGRRHPKDMGESEVTDFLSWLAVEEEVAPSTQKQAQSALLFLYDRVLERPLPPLDDVVSAGGGDFVPTVLSQREVRALFHELAPVPRLCAEVMYGSGLRISECIALRVKDLDFDRLAVIVREGKGGKDRRAPLGKRDAEALRKHLKRVREQFDADVRRDVRTTMPEGALVRKLPNADRDWRWPASFLAVCFLTQRSSSSLGHGSLGAAIATGLPNDRWNCRSDRHQVVIGRASP